MSVNRRKRRARQQGVAPRHDMSPNLLMMGSAEISLTFHQFARLLGLDIIGPCPECDAMVEKPTKIWHVTEEAANSMFGPYSVEELMEIIYETLH